MEIQDPLTERIIGAAITVHQTLGPGLLESAYQRSLEIELSFQGLSYEAQVPMAVSYRGVPLEAGYRLDLVVEGLVIVEIKAVEKLLPVHKAQLITYLKLSGIRKGLLINFHEAFLVEGVRRAVL